MNSFESMSKWAEIACQRGHEYHSSKLVEVHLGGPTPYRDLPPIPTRFARSFKMQVWDTADHPVDGLAYCPAHDSVSETINNLGVWEVTETILTLAVCSTSDPNSVVYDYGAQVGWFSLLALSYGLKVQAYDAEHENLKLLGLSAAENDWDERLYMGIVRVGFNTPPLSPRDERIRLVKIDVEGAEDQVIRILWPSIEAGLVDHLLIEISPTFDNYYPDLVTSIVDQGYDAWMVPPKQTPPLLLDSIPADLEPYRLDQMTSDQLRAEVNSWTQVNCWFTRKGASW